MCKKGKECFTEMSFLRRGWTWNDFWHTAMADSAIDGTIGAFIEKMCKMKNASSFLKA